MTRFRGVHRFLTATALHPARRVAAAGLAAAGASAENVVRAAVGKATTPLGIGPTPGPP